MLFIIIMNSNKISFLQLKPNSDKNINSICTETIQKLLSADKFNIRSDEIDDLIIDLDNHFVKHTKDDPIKFINDFFKNQFDSVSNPGSNPGSNSGSNSVSDTESNKQYYDIISYNYFDNKYNLMLVNNQINSSYVKNLHHSDQQKYFNLLASSLVQYYTNSQAVFGDVFLISIDKKYYDTLLEIGNIHKIQDDEVKTKILDSLDKKLSQIDQIYYSMSLFNYLESFALTTFVKIYEHTTKQYVYYSREYLDNFFKNIPNKTMLKNKVIKVNYEKIELYLKYDDPLPGSHYYVINMINEESQQNDSSNEYNFINITQSDITTLLE